MGKNQKEKQKSALCELKRWGSRLDSVKHPQFTLVSKEGVWRDRKRTSEQEGTLSYPGLQSHSSGNDKVHSSKANSGLHSFHCWLLTSAT